MENINYINVIEHLCYGAFEADEEELRNFIIQYDMDDLDCDTFRDLAKEIWDKINFTTKYLAISEDNIENIEPF